MARKKCIPVAGLCQLNSARFYYYRRQYPVKLRPYLGGKGEYLRSLRTRDKAEAIRLALAEEKRQDLLLADATAQWREAQRRNMVAKLLA